MWKSSHFAHARLPPPPPSPSLLLSIPSSIAPRPCANVRFSRKTPWKKNNMFIRTEETYSKRRRRSGNTAAFTRPGKRFRSHRTKEYPSIDDGFYRNLTFHTYEKLHVYAGEGGGHWYWCREYGWHESFSEEIFNVKSQYIMYVLSYSRYIYRNERRTRIWVAKFDFSVTKKKLSVIVQRSPFGSCDFFM